MTRHQLFIQDYPILMDERKSPWQYQRIVYNTLQNKMEGPQESFFTDLLTLESDKQKLFTFFNSSI